MSNRPLRICPKCYRDLDDGNRERMGLNSGSVLNLMCPGSNGPSDCDHVIHNDRLKRLAIVEYKPEHGTLTQGQQILLDGMAGDWTEIPTGRKLHTRYWVLPVFATQDEATEAYSEAVEWVWPGVNWKETYPKLVAHELRCRERKL